MTSQPELLTKPTRSGLGDRDAMLDALERLDGTGPEFGGFMTNHGPMVAEAMCRLGAAVLVPGWIDAYRRRLDGAPQPGCLVTSANWHHHLGDVRRIGDWNHFFETTVRDEGWRQVLITWWPRLLPGAAAGAGHGLLRTAHAIRSLASTPGEEPQLAGELAKGLAYWAARYQPLPGSPTGTGRSASIDAIGALPRLLPETPMVGPGIAGRLTALVVLRDFPDALDQWSLADTPTDSLNELITAAARIVANREDAPIAFCHAVTVPAAVQMVLEELPPIMKIPTVVAAWQVVGALISAYGFPASAADLAEVPTTEGLTPDLLAAAAIDHGDEHVIKLTEAALRQYVRTNDVVLLTAAERFRHRMPRWW